MSSSHGLGGNEYRAAVEEAMLTFPTGFHFSYWVSDLPLLAARFNVMN
jgi:hypothetical protein